MNVRGLALIAIFTLSGATLRAQHGGGEALNTRAPREASQFDFLVGDWELVVTPKVAGLVARIHGVPRLRGSWKGVRALDGWGLEDDLHVADESGNPIAYTHFLRVYDATAKHWIVSAIDVYRQRLTTSSAQWLNGEMLTIADAIDPDGKPYRLRTHITSITPTTFHYSQDVSHDGGATWELDHLVMEAKRATAAALR
ncbi:MAG: hypothetical protein M3Y30_12435 [Gemmatimonadota bacterium]|nr:hypothetical protein [Gemmatimonadota bacterium]